MAEKTSLWRQISYWLPLINHKAAPHVARQASLVIFLSHYTYWKNLYDCNCIQHIITTPGCFASVKASYRPLWSKSWTTNNPTCKGYISQSTAEVSVSPLYLFSESSTPLPGREFFLTAVSHWHRPALLICSRSLSIRPIPREPEEPCSNWSNVCILLVRSVLIWKM